MDLRGLRIAIVGGGIGGLALLLALRRLGGTATVYERAPQLGEVGQGLGVFANAVRALDWLGVGEEARRRGWVMREASTFAPDGSLLLRTEPGEHARRRGTPSLLMRRPDLHGLLADAVPPEVVLTGRALTWIETNDTRAILHLEDGTRAEAELLVGADGWRSAVRTHLWGEAPPRYSGLVCWRGMAEGVPLVDPHLLAVLQGAGPQFGIGPLGPDRCYWFASYPASAGSGPVDPSAARDDLLRRYAGFAMGVEAILRATPPEAMLRTDLHDRPPLARWSRGPATLLGDAAHPMVPTLGQGAATALEDAVVLARRLAAAPDVGAALGAYERERVPRTGAIVRMAHGLARLSGWTNPAAVELRMLSLRLTPAFVMRRTVEKQIGYDAASV